MCFLYFVSVFKKAIHTFSDGNKNFIFATKIDITRRVILDTVKRWPFSGRNNIKEIVEKSYIT